MERNFLSACLLHGGVRPQEKDQTLKMHLSAHRTTTHDAHVEHPHETESNSTRTDVYIRRYHKNTQIQKPFMHTKRDSQAQYHPSAQTQEHTSTKLRKQPAPLKSSRTRVVFMFRHSARYLAAAWFRVESACER